MEGSLDYSGLGVGDIIEKNLSTADILEFFQIIGKLSISNFCCGNYRKIIDIENCIQFYPKNWYFRVVHK